MKYKVNYNKDCLKYLKKLNRETQLRIIKAINELPFGDIKKLKGSSSYYRLRIGDYRVIFDREDSNFAIKVIQIASRGDVYKK